MPLSDVQICNLALDALGTRSTISAIGEQSAEGQACARHYGQALDAVLRACHWNFARKQVTMGLLKDATAGDIVPQPWMYEYTYPSDCLLARQVLPTFTPNSETVPTGWSTPNDQTPPVRFAIAQDNDVTGNAIRVILTNMAQAQLIYTARVGNSALFDPMFIDALANYLGARMWTLTGDKQKARDLLAIADQQTKSARSMNGNEGFQVIDQIPDWIRVRGYISDWAYPPGALWYYSPVDLTLVI